MSTLKTNTIQDASGGNSMSLNDLNQGRAKAWFNLNGTGTISVRDSFGIASITDNGTGDYTPTFSTIRPSINYSYQGTTGNQANFLFSADGITARTVSLFRLLIYNTSILVTDSANIDVSVQGDS